jgi:hypothetical protein
VQGVRKAQEIQQPYGFAGIYFLAEKKIGKQKSRMSPHESSGVCWYKPLALFLSFTYGSW